MMPVNSEVNFCTTVLLGASEMGTALKEVALQEAEAVSEPGLTFRSQL